MRVRVGTYFLLRTTKPTLLPTDGLPLSQCPGDGSRLNLCEVMFINNNLPVALRQVNLHRISKSFRGLRFTTYEIQNLREGKERCKSDCLLGRSGGRYSIAESKERASPRCRPRCSTEAQLLSSSGKRYVRYSTQRDRTFIPRVGC